MWPATAALIYVIVVALVAVFQRNLIYHPTRVTASVARQVAANVGLEEWRDGRGQLLGWKRGSRMASPIGRVLVLHGNAGWAIHRYDFTASLQGVAALEVYLLEYPGYGSRAGNPTQTSLYRAATEGLLALPTNLPVYVIGESLGTGPASYVAGTQSAKVSGVLLIAPFAELTLVAQWHYPWMPAHWVLRDTYPSAAYLRGYHGALAVWLAGEDTVVPREFGKELFSAYRGPKQLWEFPKAGHNTLTQRRPEDWERVVEFWLRHRGAVPQPRAVTPARQ